jgi:SAM-dependent methyltransferase
MMETAEQWSLRSWKARHDAGYFPESEQHRGWRVYEAMPDWFLEIARPKLSDYALEIGCGYGEWMIPLAQHVTAVVGVDIHEGPIAKARELFLERGVSCVAQVNDGLTLPFPDAEFSLVYSISVFQHLPRSIVQGYLRETARVLGPTGRAVHHFRNAANVGPYPPLAKDIAPNHTGDFSVGWTAGEVLDAGRDAGFAHVEVRDIGLFLVMVGR